MNLKPTTLFMAAVVVILILAAWTNNQPSAQESRLITVTGDADVLVIPDEVLLTLGIETQDKELETAKRKNDERVKQVLALTQAYGIQPQHIQTDHISIEPRYHNNYEQREFIGFFVRKTIVITLKDISKFETLLADVLDNGANYVHGIQFRTTDLRKHKDEARDLAIKAAQEKAVALAGALGQEIGVPHTIQEVQGGWWSSYNAWWGSRWGGGMAQNVIQEVSGNALTGAESIAPGQITVNAKITVSFELK